MHHKRKRPKKRRAGCLWCKPHKANGIGPKNEKNPHSADKQLQDKICDLIEVDGPIV